MGCDIHAAIERRDGTHRQHGVDAECWRFVAPLELGRNYHLFGILAGVREHRHPQITPQRGLPTDVDRASRTREEDINDDSYQDFGDHSFSWLTLAELRAYDWEQPLSMSGCIPLRDVDRRDAFDADYTETYVTWCSQPPHPPAAYCQGLTGAQILDLRTWDFLEPERRPAAIRDSLFAARLVVDATLFPEPEEPPPGALYVPIGRWKHGEKRPRKAWAHVAWSWPARETCAEFYAWLQKQEGPGDDLRIVFGFDS